MAPLARLASRLAVAALFVAQAVGHFLLNYPVSIGFDDDNESIGPCGGFDPNFLKNTVTNFHVGGDNICVTNTHPIATLLFRGIVSTSDQGNWTSLLPPVQQSGLGNFCNPAVPVPPAFSGKKGLIQVINDSPDGILYQCAAVSFVDGAGTRQTGCKNASGVTASFVADSALYSAAAATPALNASSNAKPISSSTKSAAMTIQPSFGYGAVGTTAWIIVMAIGATVAGLF